MLGSVLQSSVVFGGGGMLMHFHSSTLAYPCRVHARSDGADGEFVELLVVSRLSCASGAGFVAGGSRRTARGRAK